jgi:hypothetical protein
MIVSVTEEKSKAFAAILYGWNYEGPLYRIEVHQRWIKKKRFRTCEKSRTLAHPRSIREEGNESP